MIALIFLGCVCFELRDEFEVHLSLIDEVSHLLQFGRAGCALLLSLLEFGNLLGFHFS